MFANIQILFWLTFVPAKTRDKMELSNNTILITGGTSGFGLEFAARLIDLGNTVIVTGRDQAKLEKARRQLPAVHIFQSDVSDPNAIVDLRDMVTSRFPKLNMLINNAGQMRKIILHDLTISVQDITREVETNLMGPIRMVQAFLPHLKRMGSAAILNVTSGLALVPFPIAPIYGATKSGLRSYTKSLRVQMKNTKIKVFELVAPASETPLNGQFTSLEGYNVKLMQPEDIIDAAIKGLKSDTYEIYPGIARALLMMSKVAPGYLLKQLSKAGAREMEG
jgi:uncharacterized oxidoreductase